MPTFTISKRIFEVLKIYECRRLLYGNFGAGKTLSLILYAELVRHIWAYKQLAAKDQI
jgi:hypothetical protein